MASRTLDRRHLSSFDRNVVDDEGIVLLTDGVGITAVGELTHSAVSYPVRLDNQRIALPCDVDLIACGECYRGAAPGEAKNRNSSNYGPRPDDSWGMLGALQGLGSFALWMGSRTIARSLCWSFVSLLHILLKLAPVAAVG